MSTTSEGERIRPLKALEEEWMEENGFYYYDDMLMLGECTPQTLERVRTLPMYDGDVIISTYPRSGTTWTQELAWLICNNADLETASSVDLDVRAPYLEYRYWHNAEPEIVTLENTPPPRVIKTHLPAEYFAEQLRNPGVKAISVMRNYKDVLTSHYHFNRTLFRQRVSWSEFFELAKRDVLIYGSWARHCLSWWRLRDEKPNNLLILKYEDMKHDPEATIRKIARFCDKKLTNEQVEAIAEHTVVNNMKTLPSFKASHPQLPEVLSNFQWRRDYIRKGVVGDWQEHFSEEQAKYIDEYVKNTTEKEGLFFPDKIN